MAKTNMTSFWLKRIFVMIAVMAGALAFLLYVPEPGSASADSNNDGGGSVSSVASSVSKFYAEFRMTSRDPIKERYGDYVIVLDEESKPLGQRISRITEKNYPPTSDWEGEYKERPFATDSTLRTEAKRFVAEAGYTLVWDLNQDFIVRDRFIATGTVPGMLEEIAGAVDANFDHPIAVYFCFKKRAMVITDKTTEYLAKNCEKSQGSYSQEY
jgi:hypothetical protein